MRQLVLTLALLLPVLAAQAQDDPTHTAEAQARYAALDYAGVIDVLAPAEALPPDLAYLLGRAYQEEYQHARALDALAGADTAAVRVLRARAVSYERLGRPAAAIAAYRRALDRRPESVGLAMALARLHGEQRDHEAARQLLADATAAKPETPTIRVAYARTLVALDSLESAIVQLEIAHRQAPESEAIPLLLCQVYLADDNAYSASRVLERALDAVPDSPRLWARQGAVRQQLEAFAPAIAAYGHAVALGDSSAGTWRGLGITRYLSDDPAGALADLEVAYAADSSHARTSFYLGLAHKQLEAYDEAERWLLQAATLTGREPLADILEHLADVQRFQDAYPEAIETDEVVLFLSPGRLSAVFHLGLLYDEYYADAAPALRQYETFVRQAMASDIAQRSDILVMITYAQNRMRVLREGTFFDGEEAEPNADSSGTSATGER